ncbi:MAG: ATP-binding cassette subfamily B multidrug efflux pump [Flavobacteriales bacterium]|jgi:ATP-binding cassette subfamily B multidrug efflux pump
MKELKYLNKYFFKYKWHLIIGLLFIVLTTYFKVYAPTLFNEGVDYIENSLDAVKNDTASPPLPESIRWLNDIGLTSVEQTSANKEEQAKTTRYVILLLAVLFAVIFIIQGIFLFFTRVTLIIMSRRIEYDLKNQIYQQYQELSLSFFKRNNTGDLMNRISEDVSKVRMYLGPAVMYTLSLAFLIGFVLYAMCSISVKLTLYTLLPLPILSISIYYVSTLINKKSERVQSKQSELSSFVQETTSGIRVLKAYNRENAYMNFFRNESDSYKTLVLSLIKIEALFMPLIIMLVGLSTVLAIYLGSVEAIVGNGFDKGDIIQFIIYVNMLTWPFASVGWVTSLVNKAEASQKRINEFLKEEPEIKSTVSGDEKITGNISFEEVSFTYPDTGIEALQRINFNLKTGQTLGITGRTGSGKSTIANLISRQYDVTSGSIKIDNRTIQNVHLESLRNSIGTVPQDVFLFSDSIRNNISFSDERLTEEEIVEAAKKAAIYDNIMEFPEKFDTVLGERGINLSGGQKQRISIARAIIKSPEILIFDDCLSAVDTETEDKILRSLSQIMEGKTSVIISHRISSILGADHILVLDKGQIIEQGSHQDLIDKKGYYHELYQKQLVEE